MSFDYGAITGPLHEWERAWPYRLTPKDPYCGDEVLDVPANYQNYLTFSAGETLEELAFRAWDDAFCEAYRAILNGEDRWTDLGLAAAHLQIDLPIRHDLRPPRIAPWTLPDSRLSDAVENWVPDIGLVAPDRVLGPWADEPIPRWLRSLCGKVLCFSPLLAPAVRPMGRECRSRPRPPLHPRRGLIAMLRAPPMVWQTAPRVLSLGTGRSCGGLARDARVRGPNLQDTRSVAGLLHATPSAPAGSRGLVRQIVAGVHAAASLRAPHELGRSSPRSE